MVWEEKDEHGDTKRWIYHRPDGKYITNIHHREGIIRKEFKSLAGAKKHLGLPDDPKPKKPKDDPRKSTVSLDI